MKKTTLQEAEAQHHHHHQGIKIMILAILFSIGSMVFIYAYNILGFDKAGHFLDVFYRVLFIVLIWSFVNPFSNKLFDLLLSMVAWHLFATAYFWFYDAIYDIGKKTELIYNIINISLALSIITICYKYIFYKFKAY